MDIQILIYWTTASKRGLITFTISPNDPKYQKVLRAALALLGLHMTYVDVGETYMVFSIHVVRKMDTGADPVEVFLALADSLFES